MKILQGHLLLIFCCLMAGVTTQAETAEEMVSACHDIAAAPVSGGKVTAPVDFDSGVCWGAFSVVQRVLRSTYRSNGSQVALYGVCAPPESTRTQLIAVFVVYAKQHPEQYHEEFFDVALEAERQAFPCKAN